MASKYQLFLLLYVERKKSKAAEKKEYDFGVIRHNFKCRLEFCCVILDKQIIYLYDPWLRGLSNIRIRCLTWNLEHTKRPINIIHFSDIFICSTDILKELMLCPR